MPDSLTGNPWSIVTTGVKSTAGVHIKNLVWTNGSGSEVLVIVDNAGRDIIRDTWSASTDHNYGEFKWVQGFNVTTLGGGELIVVIHK
jgi:hypothetical protein